MDLRGVEKLNLISVIVDDVNSIVNMQLVILQSQPTLRSLFVNLLGKLEQLLDGFALVWIK